MSGNKVKYQSLSEADYNTLFNKDKEGYDIESTFYRNEESTTCDTVLDSGLITVAKYSCVSWKQYAYGIICLSLYIGIWMGSAVSVFITIFLIMNAYYFLGSILAIAILLCYIVPVTPSQKCRAIARKYIGCYFTDASVNFEVLPSSLDLPTILCIMPHGVFSIAWAFLYLSEQFFHLKWCFSTLLRLSPFLRIITQLTGHPSSIRKSVVLKHFKNKQSIAIIPGGWHEATIHHKEKDRIYIRSRKGFIKYAIQYGYSITPAFAFGERSTYTNVQGCYSFRFWLNKNSIIGSMPWGLKYCPFFPRKCCIHVVVGKPIYFGQHSNPTLEEISQAHESYINEVKRLYDQYKYKFYGPNSHQQNLEIW